MKIKKCNLENLLKNECDSYYWAGFILADGSISKKGELSIATSIKDVEHLKKLQKFLNIETITYSTTTNGYKYAIIRGMDTKIIRKFCKKFNTGPNKTYFPTNVDWIKNDNYMLSLIAGFIDGDGCIDNQASRNDFKLRIKCHYSWLSVLKKFISFIYKNERFKYAEPKIINSGYAHLSITNTVVLKNLKRKILLLKIPIMERKWNIINLEYVGRNEKSNILKNEVLEMLKNGKKNKEICQKLNIKPSTVSNIKKRNY